MRRCAWLVVGALVAGAGCGGSGRDEVDAALADAGAGADAGDGGGDGAVSPDAGTLLMPVWDPTRLAWPMFAQNPRRTGRSPWNGPRAATTHALWTYTATGGSSINIQPVVSEDGAYFATWGVSRRMAMTDPATSWLKFDGAYYGLHLDDRGSPAAQRLYAPLDPRPLPYCYVYAPHPHQTRDDVCMASNLLVTFGNGTIEGTALIDPDTRVHYVGRGDGRLYAINPGGTLRWTYDTFNPEEPADPDGGGEIIGGPVMGPGKRLYFGTFGVPWPGTASNPAYETHAVYALTSDGQLAWRYPRATARLDNPIAAAPALSADGRTLYVATYFEDGSRPGRLMALDLTRPDGASDAERLRWELALDNPARVGAPRLWVRHLSVGIDGVIYLGCGEAKVGGSAPAVVAVRDEGSRGRVAWLAEPQDFATSMATIVQGLALWEDAGAVVRIYVATAHLRDANGTGGRLYVLDPATGATQASFDPETATPAGLGGLTSPTLGNDETVYVGIRGRHDNLAQPNLGQWRRGRMYALRRNAAGTGFDVSWSFEAQGLLDWSHPAIGANGLLYFGDTDQFSPFLDQNTFFAPGAATPRHDPHFYALGE